MLEMEWAKKKKSTLVNTNTIGAGSIISEFNAIYYNTEGLFNLLSKYIVIYNWYTETTFYYALSRLHGPGL